MVSHVTFFAAAFESSARRAYVDCIKIVCHDDSVVKLLKSLAGEQSLFGLGTWKIRYASEPELAKVLTALRDAGVAMAGAPAGWTPAAIFQDLRERGMVAGHYQEISRIRPGGAIVDRK